MKIGLMAGSTRTGSYNRQVLELAARDLAARGHAVTQIDLAKLPLPIFAADDEVAAFPDNARTLKRLLQAQDALLIAAPEYNGSLPPLLKNAIDWASRPTDGEAPMAWVAFRGKPVAILSASPGTGGGMRMQQHLRQILSLLQAVVIPAQFALPQAHLVLADGTLADPLSKQILADTLDQLEWLGGLLAGAATAS
ncbi:MAG: NADPH-dependent FMN reductase [Novosphingobium sp.]